MISLCDLNELKKEITRSICHLQTIKFKFWIKNDDLKTYDMHYSESRYNNLIYQFLIAFWYIYY